jgi:uncharacterized membrane protein
MIKKNKWKLLLSSLIILLPTLLGAIFWNHLPEEMAMHWGIDGKADAWGSPLVLVVFLPLILLALHWLCFWITARDNQANDQSQKVVGMVLWILPFCSLFCTGITCAAAFGRAVDVVAWVFALLGATFLFIGNYMPKCKQNRTIGIKIFWTLANEDNWNKTHRFGGRIAVAVGLLCFPAALLPIEAFPYVLPGMILALVGAPTLYSYLYYKKQLREGTATKIDYKMKKADKTHTVLVSILVSVILAGCVVLCFTGDCTLQYGDTAFRVEATYWNGLTVDYDAIESIEYREDGGLGIRANGVQSPRLSLGIFQNDEFGTYTRYTYTDCDAYVVLKVNGKILVLGGKTAEESKAIYDTLLPHVEK